MKGQIAAVFDLDHTLTAVRSVESMFIKFMMRERHVCVANYFRSAEFLFRNIWQDPVKAIKHNKKYLQGFTIAELESLAQRFLAENGDKMIPPEHRDLVIRHKNNDYLTILITGSPEFLACPLIPLCGLPFDHLYATQLKIVNGRHTGDIEGVHYYGEKKAQLVQTLSKELGFSLTESYCYADSKSDIPMMSLFGKPVAVNPDSELSRESTRSNWQIITTNCP